MVFDEERREFDEQNKTQFFFFSKKGSLYPTSSLKDPHYKILPLFQVFYFSVFLYAYFLYTEVYFSEAKTNTAH